MRFTTVEEMKMPFNTSLVTHFTFLSSSPRKLDPPPQDRELLCGFCHAASKTRPLSAFTGLQLRLWQALVCNACVKDPTLGHPLGQKRKKKRKKKKKVAAVNIYQTQKYQNVSCSAHRRDDEARSTTNPFIASRLSELRSALLQVFVMQNNWPSHLKSKQILVHISAHP